jgi:hypothetical protein
VWEREERNIYMDELDAKESHRKCNRGKEKNMEETKGERERDAIAARCPCV